MSIAQLDDPSMREALGIETDNPTSLANPTQIGQGNGSVQLQCGPAASSAGELIVNSIDAAGTLGAGEVIINDPVDQNYRNLILTSNGVVFQQAATGTSYPLAQFTNATGDIALSATTAALGSISGCATAAITDLTVTDINGSAYPPSVVPNNTATTGVYSFASIPAYPSSIWYGTVQNRVPAGKNFLLTMCLNFILTPTAPFVGHDRLNVRCGQQTGNPANPANNFAEPNLDLIYPDGTAYTSYPFTVVNQVEAVSDGMGLWAVILEAIGGTNTYTITGTGGVISITELFS